MTTSSRKRIAGAICALASRIAPAHRATLVHAMAVELDHVDDRDALQFAVGCLYCTLGWWLATADGVSWTARVIISTGTAALGVSCLVVALRLWAQDAQNAALFLAAMAVFYAGAAGVAWTTGLKASAHYFGAGIVLNTLASLAFGTLSSDVPPHARFLQALGIEAYGLLALLIGLALSAHWLSLRLRTKP
jgi:hypothetical protein